MDGGGRCCKEHEVRKVKAFRFRSLPELVPVERLGGGWDDLLCLVPINSCCSWRLNTYYSNEDRGHAFLS